MTDVKISQNGSTVAVVSPYLPPFVAAAKRLGGQWKAPAWVFDARDEERVRDLCIEHYGTDGSPAVGAKTLRVVIAAGAEAYADAFRLGGREIARATGRDSGARLGAGVVVLRGEFGSGGSVKNWETTCVRGATVLVRDVPAAMCDRLVCGDEAPSWVESITVEEEAAVVDRAALTAERARLVARMAEIDALLGAA